MWVPAEARGGCEVLGAGVTGVCGSLDVELGTELWSASTVTTESSLQPQGLLEPYLC